MKCPFCKHEKTKVVSTAGWLDEEIPRSRICERCGYSFSTTEVIDRDSKFMERLRAYEEKCQTA